MPVLLGALMLVLTGLPATAGVGGGDVAISISDGVDVATPGDPIAYDITVTNIAGGNVTGTIHHTYPGGYTGCSIDAITPFGGASGVTDYSAGSEVEVHVSDIPYGGYLVVTIGCTIDAATTGIVTTNATWSSPNDQNAANDSASDSTTMSNSVDIGVTISDGVAGATPGDSVVYTIASSNNGPADDPAVVLAVSFPGDLTCTYSSSASGGAAGNTASGAGDLAETLSMPAGSTVTYTVSCMIDAGAIGTLSTTATTAASATDPVPDNDSATDDDTVLTPSADGSVTVDDGATTATPGESVTYTIAATNNGPSDDPSARLLFSTSPSLVCAYTDTTAAPVSVPAGPANELDTAGAVDAGSTLTFTAVCDIPSSASGNLTATATVTSIDGFDPDAGNDTAADVDTLVGQADLSVTLTDDADPVTTGDEITFTIVVDNAGPSDASNIVATSTLAAGQSLVGTSGCAEDPAGAPTCSLGGLSSGGQAQFTITTRADTASPSVQETTVAVASDMADPAPGNDSAAESTIVNNPPSTGGGGGGGTVTPPDEPGPEEPAPGGDGMAVIDHDDPVDAAIAISQQRFQSTGSVTRGVMGLAPRVVLARVDVFADALAGSSLTGDAPLLFTGADALDPRTLTEVDRLLPGGGEVLVLGGEAALPEAILDELVAAGHRPERLAGPTRIHTALAIADRVAAGATLDHVGLARAFGTESNETAGWVDSATAGGWAANTGSPVLLTGTEELHADVAEWLATNTPLRVTALGGTAAVSDAAAEAAGADRIGGANRFETAAAVATDLFGSGTGFIIANGTAPDAWTYILAGAGLAAETDRPILLVERDRLPAETAAALCAGDPGAVVVIGPDRLIDATTRQAAIDACG